MDKLVNMIIFKELSNRFLINRANEKLIRVKILKEFMELMEEYLIILWQKKSGGLKTEKSLDKMTI